MTDRHIHVEDFGMATESVSVAVVTHMWIWWAHIAVEHEAEAHGIRDRVRAAGEIGDALTRETYASMIAISASAHSLDALYGAIKELLPPRAGAKSRWAEILETLKRAFLVRGDAAGGRWAQEFEWLFDLRDAAVHFKESSNPTAPHPLGTHTGLENVAYSLESAQRAVSLLLEVLDVATTKPRAEVASVAEWSERMRASVLDVAQRRHGT